ncbi:trypsin-like serine peptidase [Sorangium sp. KYC3313]|uniref:trypsin-like serine peptidase n=1 Tax=Sorangium sp. KYC3313 TaxID=3449740 RepID=UPI003F890834
MAPEYPYDHSGDADKAAAHEAHKRLLQPVKEDEFSVIVGNGETGEEYQVIQTLEGLKVAAEYARKLGHDGRAERPTGDMAPVAAEEELRPPRLGTQSIVGPADNRLDFRISAFYPATAWPQTTMVRVTNNHGAGSGTMIGARIAITNAHGTVDSAGGIDWPRIVPRQDTTSPAPPYGVVGAQTYAYPTAWVTRNCPVNPTWECNAHDWVILILWPSPFGGSHPGYLGYAANSNDAVVQSWAHHLWGFPGCGVAQSPPGCTDGVLFGGAGEGQNPGPIVSEPLADWPFLNAKSRLSHRVDNSEGVSGAGVFSYAPAAGGPYVISTSISNGVVANTGGLGPRVTDTLVSYFNSVRAQFP